jgi:hypothetical protein
VTLISPLRRGGPGRHGFAALVALALGILAFSPLAAHAEAPDPKVTARAKALEGTRIADEGQHARALELFQEAYALFPEPAYLYDMGVEFQALGRDVEAFDAYRRFLADPKGTPRSLVAHASELSAELDKRLGEIQLRGAPSGAEVAVDDQARGALPLPEPLRAKAGLHRVIVRQQGVEPFRAEVRVPEGGAAIVDVGGLTPIDAATPTAAAAPRTPWIAWSFSTGLALWTAGPPSGTGPAPTFAAGAWRSIATLPSEIDFQLGGKVGFTYFSEPLGTSSFVSLLASARLVKTLAPRWNAFADLGVGVLVIAGVPDASQLFGANGGRPTGALSTFELRPQLGVAYAITDGLALSMAPAFVWNPSPSERFADASLSRFEIGIGLAGAL